jgi:hypothetical protein
VDDLWLRPLGPAADMMHGFDAEGAEDREVQGDTECGAAYAPLPRRTGFEEHSQHGFLLTDVVRRSGLRSLDATLAPPGEGHVSAS